MLSNLTILFLIAHVLADFYLPSPKTAGGKEKKLPTLGLNCALYAAVMFACAGMAFLLRPDLRLIFAALALSALHTVAVLIRSHLNKKGPFQSLQGQARLYVADQFFHILCIVFIMDTVAHPLPLPGPTLRWVLLVLMIHKPANLTFKKLLSKYEAGDGKAATDTIEGAGAIIGSLERMLCAIFIGLGQYASIGLIYTAKSIARFKKIEENPKFAEYYLIGTLYSILFVVVCYLLVVKTL